MNYLTKKQIEVFDKQKDNLRRAYYSDWKTHTMMWDNIELANIYTEVTGETLNNWNCSSCALKNYKRMGKLYFDSIEHYKNIRKADGKSSGGNQTNSCSTKKRGGKGQNKKVDSIG